MAILSSKKLLVSACLVLALAAPVSASAASDDTTVSAAQNGIEYLANNQADDGSIAGYGSETDWSAIAVEAGGQDATEFNSGSGASLIDSMQTNPLPPTAPATDVERKIIAINAAGQDSTDFGGKDYDAWLASYHNNGQIGDVTLLNDDIFGVIAAGAAQNPALQAAAQDALNYFLAHQSSDGGFSYTTNSCAYCGSDSNDTAAAIIAMHAAKILGLSGNLDPMQASALAYLLSTQQADGGFGYDVYSPSDGSSTAWGLMALNTIGESMRQQAQAARDWLLANQNADGGFRFGAYGVTDSDTFTTAHAIIALLGTNWLLQPEPLHAAPKATPANKASDAGSSFIGSLKTSSFQNQHPLSDTQTADTTVNTKSNNPILESLKKDNPEPRKDTSVKSSHPLAMYAAIGLALLAISWYVLQSKNQKTEGA